MGCQRLHGGVAEGKVALVGQQMSDIISLSLVILTLKWGRGPLLMKRSKKNHSPKSLFLVISVIFEFSDSPGYALASRDIDTRAG